MSRRNLEDRGASAPPPEVSAITRQVDLRVHDDVALDEIELYAEVLTAVAVSDDEIMDAVRSWARTEGIFAAPEGAASLAAYRKLRSSGFLSEKDRTVLFNSGTGLKYLDVIQQKKSVLASRHIGGIIGPY